MRNWARVNDGAAARRYLDNQLPMRNLRLKT